MEARKIQMGLLVSALVLGLLSSCAVVRSFQKSYLRDSEMILSPRQVQSMELNFQVYREGSSGANGGKSGGGCGCN